MLGMYSSIQIITGRFVKTDIVCVKDLFGAVLASRCSFGLSSDFLKPGTVLMRNWMFSLQRGSPQGNLLALK
jgi:hypothetical protein